MLRLNGHDYSHATLRGHTLTVTTHDAAMVRAYSRLHGGERETFSGEYTISGVTYILAGGVMKSGNPQSGRYEFVFETVRP